VDLVLVTGAARPGGEPPSAFALRWIRALRGRLAAQGRTIAIEVDGGVDARNAAALVAAGADALVVESGRCRSTERAGTIAALKRLAS
jgi:ribulose-phosphate 3-epimerase